MTWLLSLFAILAGISNPLQSGSNSELMKVTNAAVVAAFVVNRQQASWLRRRRHPGRGCRC
jgi:uncharacterized membrane protein YdcZ (DUF606 family)